MSKTRPGRAPSLLRGRWCAPDRRLSSGRHLPRSSGQSLRPRFELPATGGHLHEASSRVHSRSPIAPSRSPRRAGSLPAPTGLLLACACRVERQTLGFSPERRTPQLPATHVEVETGHTHGPEYYTFGISPTSSSASHLTSRTLTSHVIAGGLHRHHADLLAQQPVPKGKQRVGHRRERLDLLRAAPLRRGLGTRTQALTSRLLMSRAAHRSCSTSITDSSRRSIRRRPEGPAGSKSLTRGLEAPIRSACQRPPIPKLICGLHRTKTERGNRTTSAFSCIHGAVDRTPLN